MKTSKTSSILLLLLDCKHFYLKMAKDRVDWENKQEGLEKRKDREENRFFALNFRVLKDYCN